MRAKLVNGRCKFTHQLTHQLRPPQGTGSGSGVNETYIASKEWLLHVMDLLKSRFEHIYCFSLNNRWFQMLITLREKCLRSVTTRLFFNFRIWPRVRLDLSNSKNVSISNVWFFCVLYVPSVLWYCWLGLPYNLYCVGGDVTHCSLQSNSCLFTFLFGAVFLNRVTSNLCHITVLSLNSGFYYMWALGWSLFFHLGYFHLWTLKVV